MKGLRELSLPFLVPALLLSVSGCDPILPNLIPIKKPQTIRRVEVGKSTRQDVLRILGKPQVVETPDLYVYAWERSNWFTTYEAFGLRATRAIVEFDSEGNVTRLDSSWDETEPWLPFLVCSEEIPGCAGRRSLTGFNVTALEFTPDGERLAIATTVKKWNSCILDLFNGEVLTLGDSCFALSFSADGRRLAAVCGRSLVVWEASDGTERMRVCPTGSKSCAVLGVSVALSPDGEGVAFRQRGKGLILQGVEGGGTVFETDGFAPVFSPAGSLVAVQVGNGAVAILESTSGTVLASRTSESKSRWRARALAFSPDGRYLAVSSCAHAEIHLLDRIRDTGSFHKPEAVALLPIPRRTGFGCRPRLVFSRDGQRLAVLTGDALARFEVPSGKLLSAERYPGPSTLVAVDSGLKRLVLVDDMKLRACDLE